MNDIFKLVVEYFSPIKLPDIMNFHGDDSKYSCHMKNHLESSEENLCYGSKIVIKINKFDADIYRTFSSTTQRNF